MNARLRKAGTLTCGFFLVLVFLGQGVAFIGANSQTFDEAVYLAAGYSYLVTGDFRLDTEHPPLSRELAALPVYLAYRVPFAPTPQLWSEAEEWQIGRDFLYGSAVPHEKLLAAGRLPNLVLGAVLVGLTGWWAYRLWGKGAALAALGLAALDPNLVAHASLITPDLCLTLFTFLTLYLLWEYVASPSPWLLLAVGLSTGCALASKFTAVVLAGTVVVVLGLHALRAGSFSPKDGEREGEATGLGRRLARAGVPARRILIVALLTVPFFYFLHGCLAWPVGFRSQLDRPAGATYFLGDVSAHGWLAYFPVAILIKTPVGTLLMVLASLLLYRAGKRLGWHEALFLVLPPGLFLAAMMLGRVNIGLRYVLPIYPFLFVLASRVATVRACPGVPGWLVAPLLAGVPLALTAASSLRAAPNQLAYFNELVGGPEEGERYLSDSNLDWGQGLPGLRAYLGREGVSMIYLSYFGTAPPSAYGIRYQYLPGYFDPLQQPSLDLLPPDTGRELLAISATNLQGTYLQDQDLYRWLARRQPVAKVGYAIYVYDVTGDADAHRRLADVYSRRGFQEHAARELEKARLLTSPPTR